MGRDHEAVFWDIGGVLVELASVREGYAAFVAELADEYGLDPDDALDTWRTALGEHFRGREGTEYRTAAEGYRKATEALFDDPPPASEWRPVFDRCTSAALRSEDGAVETVRALSEAGVYQGVVSDIDTREAESMLGAFGIADVLDDVTTSEEVGYTKPDPKMFETALAKARRVGIDPSTGLMVGDRYDHDIAGGARAGLTPVAYGEEAAGPAAAHVVTDLREVLDVVGVEPPA